MFASMVVVILVLATTLLAFCLHQHIKLEGNDMVIGEERDLKMFSPYNESHVDKVKTFLIDAHDMGLEIADKIEFVENQLKKMDIVLTNDHRAFIFDCLWDTSGN